MSLRAAADLAVIGIVLHFLLGLTHWANYALGLQVLPPEVAQIIWPLQVVLGTVPLIVFFAVFRSHLAARERAARYEDEYENDR